MPAPPALDLEQLYAETADRVYAFAYRMLGDRDAAMDAVQEAFERAFASRDSYRGDASPIGWVMAITRNACLRQLRGQPRRAFDTYEAIIDEESVATPSVASEVERRTYLAEVKEGCLTGLLQCLPVAQRCVFVLHVLNEVPINEVAAVVGRSENAVRILLSRARARMRRFLCANCSFLGGERCTCERMIDFSLRHDLIERYRPEMPLPVEREELRRFADEVQLYRSLPDPGRATAAIAAAIESRRYAIFRHT